MTVYRPQPTCLASTLSRRLNRFDSSGGQGSSFDQFSYLTLQVEAVLSCLKPPEQEQVHQHQTGDFGPFSCSTRTVSENLSCQLVFGLMFSISNTDFFLFFQFFYRARRGPHIEYLFLFVYTEFYVLLPCYFWKSGFCCLEAVACTYNQV